MKNVVDFPDVATLKAEAAQWLIRLDSEDKLSHDERSDLGEWLHRSPAHREELRRLAELWQNMNVLTELSVPLGQPVLQKSRSRYRPAQARIRTAVAASAIVAVVLSLLTWQYMDRAVETNGVYATAIGEQQSTTLSDGSIVMLNTNTEIRVNYSDEYRDVHLLHGEAHFTVAENPNQKFRVFAGTGRIDAVGTAFSVYLKDDQVDVTVTEGRVALAALSLENEVISDQAGDVARVDKLVTAEKDLGTLKAGQVATIASQVEQPGELTEVLSNVRELEKRDLSRRMSWTEGSLIISGQRLEDVVEEISRYTTVSIEFADPAVASMTVGGRFPVGETAMMFETLETNFGLQVTRVSASHVVVSARNP